jgi:glycosyltransferase involved in cell wall biosynthesis
MKTVSRLHDLFVFSHLRWDFVFQRPQHLLTRCAAHHQVYYIEEPLYSENTRPRLEVTPRGPSIQVVVPHLPHGLTGAQTHACLKALVDELVSGRGRRSYVTWYYTPMALPFTAHLTPAAVVYDCMDELSHFKAAPPEITQLEEQLFGMADVVFTGGLSLYEYKKQKHSNIHPFPSSVDVAHFRRARAEQPEPCDQIHLPRPRIGFAGVIDERFDVDLVAAVAHARPQWQFVMIGPVVKIDPDTLPRAQNVHYLGAKAYADLPSYLSGWDVAILPFARNDATRFISPTKTPEYLAAGRPVVSTSIRDVVRGYGATGLVRIADEPRACIEAIEAALLERHAGDAWLKRVDDHLSRDSWDHTFARMWHLVEQAAALRRADRERRRRSAYSTADSSAAAHSTPLLLLPPAVH